MEHALCVHRLAQMASQRSAQAGGLEDHLVRAPSKTHSGPDNNHASSFRFTATCPLDGNGEEVTHAVILSEV